MHLTSVFWVLELYSTWKSLVGSLSSAIPRQSYFLLFLLLITLPSILLLSATVTGIWSVVVATHGLCVLLCFVFLYSFYFLFGWYFGRKDNEYFSH